MHLRRHHGKDDEVREPVWAGGKPSWTEVRIGAPKASELAGRDDVHQPHVAA